MIYANMCVMCEHIVGWAHLYNVMNKRHAEIPIKLYGLILQHIFQTACIVQTKYVDI